MIAENVRTVVSSPEFLGALPAGAAVMAVGVLLFAIRRRPVAIGGIVFALAGLLLLRDTPVVTGPIVIGLVVYAAAGLVGDGFSMPLAVRLIVAAPGAWLLGTALPVDGAAWITPATVVLLTLAGPLVATFDRSLVHPPLGPLFLAVVIGGSYLTLPDTEEILTLVPVAAAVGLCGWPLRTMRLGGAGTHAALALLSAVAVWDGRGRPSSMIGVAAMLTVPVVWTALAAVTRTQLPATNFGKATLTAVHVAVVLVGARVVGLVSTIRTAVVLAVAVVILAALILYPYGRASTRTDVIDRTTP